MPDGEVSKKWYGNNWLVAALIWVFFPVGLFLMWKYANWNKKLKWGISGIFALLLLYGVIASATAKVPVITLDAFKDNQTVTADSILVKGKVDPSSSQITINGKNINVASDGSFSYTVPLNEGTNTIKVEADNIGKTSQIAKAVNRQLSPDEVAAKQKTKEQAVTKATPMPTSTSTTKPTATPTSKSNQPSVPADYKSALSQADTYANTMHMSKQGVYDQLVSQYGGQFTPAAAQYAIDNVKSDWNANALAKAKTYQDTMHLSPAAIHDQLTSENGEKFTQSEADYAIQHLND